MNCLSRFVFVFAALVLSCLPFTRSASSQTAKVRQADDMTFVDDLHGWIIGNDETQVIFRTVDGGKTWSRLPVPSGIRFYPVRFFDQLNGYALSMTSIGKEAIYRSTDAGDHWTKMNEIELSSQTNIVDMTLTSASEGFFVGEGSGGRGAVVQFLDAGHLVRLRQDLPVDFRGQSNALTAFGDGKGHLWIAGKQFILHSADNGKTWEDQATNAIPRIDLAVRGVALPGGHAWLAVANWNIYKTDDYGKHWTRVLTARDQGYVNFQGIAFRDPLHGCAVGTSPSMFCTSDGGTTWSQSLTFKNYSNGWPYASRLKLFSSLSGWAIVGGALFKTLDGGQTFSESLTNTAPVESSTPGELQALTMNVNGPTELAYDRRGFLYIVEGMQQRVLRLNLKHGSIKIMTEFAEGPGVRSSNPQSVAEDQDGNTVEAEFNGRLRKFIVQSGEMQDLGAAFPQATRSRFYPPHQMAFDHQGNLLIAGGFHQLFRWSAESREIELVAGTGRAGFSGDGGPAEGAQLQWPQGVAVNAQDDIFIADYQNCRIRKVDGKTRTITTVAGTGECASRGDGGLALNAALDYPSAVAFSGSGDLFIIEGGRVRRIDSQGVITTYAGGGQPGFGGDGGPADKALLNNPAGIAVDSDGAVYISEFVNNRIRRVDPVTHIITTVAGNGKPFRVDSVM